MAQLLFELGGSLESFVTVATQTIVLGLYELDKGSRGDAELSQLLLQAISADPLSAPSLFNGTIRSMMS